MQTDSASFYPSVTWKGSLPMAILSQKGGIYKSLIDKNDSKTQWNRVIKLTVADHFP